ncbi:meckelin isoform 4 [Stylonychia lemnae]|uniref:Meckelin isoform 4 n=1 Tax=Stylonychia lemnae TaxID=5949 RepID=A0A078AY18_STYLE|nr:meckelin isoform 4 [Stylonychia lemnae]|eukprot:CDW85678.1 meckelin isoform 4 [Stylonychia lemnae]
MQYKFIITCLCLVLFTVYQVRSQVTLQNTASRCTTTQYFDSSTFECKSCPENLQPDSNRTGCECKPGYYIDSNSQDKYFPTCLKCDDSAGATQDKSRCLGCTGTATFNDNIDVKDCVCPLYNRIVEKDAQNNFLPAKECAPCLQSAYSGPNNRPIYSCDVCPAEGQLYTPTTIPWSCACLTSNYTSSYGICLLNTDVTAVRTNFPLENARTINYDYVETGSDSLGQVTVVISDTYNYLYYDAAVGCQELGNPKKCQVLANLCVLQMYNERTIVCSLFKSIVANLSPTQANSFYKDSGWKVGFPWLYYLRNANEVLTEQKRVKFRVSFGYENLKIGILNKLIYKIGKFNMEGDFLGFDTVTDQLQVCETSTDEVQRMMNFGTTIENSCTFDLSTLTSSQAYDHPENQNIFYELYIQDYNGDLIDVPVLIRNFQDAQGQKPNEESVLNQNTWRLVRRFFMFDTISGIEGTDGYKKGQISTVVRYPKDLTMRIKLDLDSEEMIFTPLLIITYRERSRTRIETNSLATVKFTSEYAMDMTNFWTTIGGLLIGLLVFFGIIVITQLVIWYQLPTLSDDVNAKCKYAIVKFIITGLDVYSQLFFWFLVIVTGYWFVFFKLQERVYVLLPTITGSSDNNYMPFNILFGTVLGTKIITLLYKIIFEQCSFDLFLVDWEKPKFQEKSQGVNGVNAWRQLFLLNEFNELQTTKLISMEFTLLCYAFFMEGVGWRYLSTHDPELRNTRANSPENYVLNFFVTAFMMYVIGIAQYVFRYGIKFRKPLNIEEFTDLCAMSNISVLMFDNQFHGYYIHGRSPYGQSEVSSENLRKSLEYEITGKAQMRGLTEESPNLQTYEIYMPRKMLIYYKDLYYKEINQEILNIMNTKTNRFNSVQQILTREKAVPSGLNVQALEDPGLFMNRLMQTYVEKVRIEPKQYIKSRDAISRWLGLMPKIENADAPTMFKDPWMNFSTYLLSGLDFDFVMLDVLIISFIDMAGHKNSNLESRIMLGILIAYLLDNFLIFLRTHYGRRNVAKHTLADERFLI